MSKFKPPFGGVSSWGSERAGRNADYEFADAEARARAKREAKNLEARPDAKPGDYAETPHGGDSADRAEIAAEEARTAKAEAIRQKALAELKENIVGAETLEGKAQSYLADIVRLAGGNDNVKESKIFEELRSLAHKAGYEDLSSLTYEEAKSEQIKLGEILAQINEDIDLYNSTKSGFIGSIKKLFSSRDRMLLKNRDSILSRLNLLDAFTSRVEEYSEAEKGNQTQTSATIEPEEPRPEEAFGIGTEFDLDKDAEDDEDAEDEDGDNVVRPNFNPNPQAVPVRRVRYATGVPGRPGFGQPDHPVPPDTLPPADDPTLEPMDGSGGRGGQDRPPAGLVVQNPERGRDGSGEKEREAGGVEIDPNTPSDNLAGVRRLANRLGISRLLPVVALIGGLGYALKNCEAPDFGGEVVEDAETPDRAVTAESIENADGSITTKITITDRAGNRIENPEITEIAPESFEFKIDGATFDLAANYLRGQGELNKKGAEELSEQVNIALQLVAANIEGELRSGGLTPQEISALDLVNVKLPSAFVQEFGALLNASAEGVSKRNLGQSTAETRVASVKTELGLELDFTFDHAEDASHFEEIIAVAETDADLAKLIDPAKSDLENVNRIMKEIRDRGTAGDLKTEWAKNAAAESISTLDQNARAVDEITVSTRGITIENHIPETGGEFAIEEGSAFDIGGTITMIGEYIRNNVNAGISLAGDELSDLYNYLTGKAKESGDGSLTETEDIILDVCETFADESGLLDFDGQTFMLEVIDGECILLPTDIPADTTVEKASGKTIHDGRIVDLSGIRMIKTPNEGYIPVSLSADGRAVMSPFIDSLQAFGVNTEGNKWSVDLNASAETAPGVTSEKVAKEEEVTVEPVTESSGESPQEEEATQEAVDVVQLEADVIDAVKQRGREALKDLIAKTSDKQALRSVVQQLRETSDRELAEEGISLTSTNRSKLALMISEIDRGA